MSFPEGYYCASAFCRRNKQRGGSVIFVKNSCQSKVLNIEQLCVELHFEASAIIVEQFKLIIVSIYHSPTGNADIFLENLDKLMVILAQRPNYTVVVGGDINNKFNINKDLVTVNRFLNILRQNNFYCLNITPTRGSNCLDNIFVNCVRHQVNSCHVFDFPLSDHKGLFLNLKKPIFNNCDTMKSSKTNEIVSSFSNDKLNLVFPASATQDLICSLDSFDWHHLLSNFSCWDDANYVFNAIFEVIIRNRDNFKVLKRVKGNNTACKRVNTNWYTPELANMKQRLLFLGKLQTQNAFEELKALKSQYRKKINEAKLKYNVDKIEKSSNKCKAAWTIINANNNKNNELAKLYKPDVLPDVFNKYFIDSVKEIKDKINKPKLTVGNLIEKAGIEHKHFEWNAISSMDVINAAKRLKNKNSNDIYGMSNHFLKNIINAIALPLSFAFNQCLKEGCFPEKLKKSKICPIFKKGQRSQPESYRPISLIPVIGKLFEVLVHDQVSTFFEHSNLFSSSQFGFRRGRSTVDVIDGLIREILSTFENRTFAQITLCDLSKAFDCVDHEDILLKLKYYGITGTCHDFFTSYLKNRRQIVSVGNECSMEASVKWGVPQGSVLGPLLFLISINDLPSSVNAKSFLYADDSTFLNTAESISKLKMFTQTTIEDAALWFRANGFLMNDSKSQKMLFTLRPVDDTIKLDMVSNTKLLGIYLDTQLNWHTHINYITSKLSRVIYLLKRLKHCVPFSYLRTSYFAFFQSVFSYGLILYGNCSKINDILILQKKVIRLLANADYRAHCRPLFTRLKLQTIINLYIFNISLYNLNKKDILKLNNEVHNYNTRNRNNVVIDYFRLTKTLSSHTVVSLKVYNKLIHLINLYPKNIFEKRFYSWLLKNPFYSVEEFFQMNVEF